MPRGPGTASNLFQAMTQKPRYTLIFEPMAQTPWQTPPICRLKKLLKAAGRAYGLRCVSAVEQPAPEQRNQFPGQSRLGEPKDIT